MRQLQPLSGVSSIHHPSSINDKNTGLWFPNYTLHYSSMPLCGIDLSAVVATFVTTIVTPIVVVSCYTLHIMRAPCRGWPRMEDPSRILYVLNHHAFCGHLCFMRCILRKCVERSRYSCYMRCPFWRCGNFLRTLDLHWTGPSATLGLLTVPE